MKLIGSPASPFVRKIRVLLIEKGHGDVDVEMHDPWSNPPELTALNPFSRVPALVLSNGVVFYDSKLIADYIESTMQGPRFVPEAGAGRWFVLQAQAHADNMLDVGIRALLERRRPADKQIKDKIMRDELAVARGISSCAKIVKGLEPKLNLGHISLAVALGWVDFRLPHIKWREKQPSLAAWYQDMRLRPSMQSTIPVDSAKS
ncbi:MAG: glutathione S-transferase [Rhodomicrobium sp.]|nr:MAG: glutathione S-transferase [Rhodomicrobium sp.]